MGRAHSDEIPLENIFSVLGAPASIMRSELAGLLGSGPSLCALEALRGTSGGETMTIPGGAGTLCKRTDNFLRARRIGFYHGVGASTEPPLGAPTLRFAPVLCCRVFLMYRLAGLGRT